MTIVSGTTIDPEDVARFEKVADQWWDPNGPFRPLHILNPIRLDYIRSRLTTRFGKVEGLNILDIGCGGGLISEPMARLGAHMTGADATEKNVLTARAHAARTGLAIDYRHTTAEALADEGAQFDAIINMEVIEHVADPALFLSACHSLLKPGGMMLVSTLNRTPESFLKAIIGAEYVLGWLPKGTHNWKQFFKPSELSRLLRDAGFDVGELKGLTYAPLSGEWSLTGDLSVNYIGTALKAG